MSDTFTLLCGCPNCGKTTQINGAEPEQFLFPKGIVVNCPGCREQIGHLTFESRDLLERALTPADEVRTTEEGKRTLIWMVQR